MAIIAYLVSAGLAWLWAVCVFLQCLPAELARWGRNTAARRARPRAPKGYEWRRVNRLGGRVVAVRFQVILA